MDENNHFTEYDVLCALKTYHHPKEQAWRRRTEFISKKTGIPLTPNKRNGRKQAVHLKVARAVRDALHEDWRYGNGRPKKAQLVQKWRAEHPDGRKEDCHRETGMSRDTIRKWWDAPVFDVRTIDEILSLDEMKTFDVRDLNKMPVFGEPH